MAVAAAPRAAVTTVCEGVLLLDKPGGMTSNRALQEVRKLFGRVKAGHTGTLDPIATGLLPLCLGEATKFAAGLLEADKTYEAVVRLGAATTTGDSEGEVVFRGDTQGCAERVPAILRDFTGEIEQLPPMYSALKHNGRALYSYARAGETIEREPRRVIIKELELIAASPAEISIRVSCSKGTYIRTLAQDIGERLGSGAHLTALRRTRIGALSVEHAVTLDALSSFTPALRQSLVRPVDLLLADLPTVVLDSTCTAAVLQGRAVSLPDRNTLGSVRLHDQTGAFIGVAVGDGQGAFAPKRMRATQI